MVGTGILRLVSPAVSADQIDIELSTDVGRITIPRPVFSSPEARCTVNRDFIGALLQLNAEKGVPKEILIETLEQAIESAYRRNADAPENVVVKVDPDSGQISVYREYEVVATSEEIEDDQLQMLVAEAQKVDPTTGVDRKSTRLNSSHRCISYAVF